MEIPVQLDLDSTRHFINVSWVSDNEGLHE